MDVMRTVTVYPSGFTPTPTVTPLHHTLLPREEPTITRDPWECATKNISQYFHPPKPTGDVLTAILSYADDLYADCTKRPCPFPEAASWCAFSTAAPASLMPGYWAYGSSASSWWSKRSSTAEEIATICPNTWYTIMNEVPGGAVWLNDTIVFSECYESAQTVMVMPTRTNARVAATSNGADEPSATVKDAENVVGKRELGNRVVAAAGASLVVAAVNSVL